MKKEMPLPVVLAVIAAACLIALGAYLLRERAMHPVYHVGPNQTFDMKTGRVVPKEESAPATAPGASAAP